MLKEDRATEEVIRDLSMSDVDLDPKQPRTELGDLAGLKLSIQRYGILQPPIVTPTQDRYSILAGQRRFVAAQQLGLAPIKVIVRSVEDHERRYLQLVENLQREDLDPFEQAGAFRQLMDEYGITEEELGARVGKSQDYVSRALTIADNIPPEIRREYYATSRKVSPSLLLEISRAGTPDMKTRMWKRAREGRYTVRQARDERAQGRREARPGRNGARPRHEVIRLDQARVTVHCRGEASAGEILAFLREAARFWEQRIHLNEIRITRGGAR